MFKYIVMPNRVDKSDYSKYLFHICLTAILALMLSRIFSLLLSASFPDFVTSPLGMKTLMAVNSIISFLLPAVILNQMMSLNGRFISYESLSVDWSRYIMYPIVLLLSLLPLTALLSDLGRDIMSLDMFAEQREMFAAKDIQLKRTYDLLLTDVSVFDYMTNILFFGFIVGFSEELFFRGIVQNYLCRFIKPGLVAVFLSALLFSIAHFDFNELLSRTLLGFAIGYVYYRTNNIFVPILMHVANNILAVVLYPYSFLESYISQWYIVLIGLVLAIISIFRMKKVK